MKTFIFIYLLYVATCIRFIFLIESSDNCGNPGDSLKAELLLQIDISLDAYHHVQRRNDCKLHLAK